MPTCPVKGTKRIRNLGKAVAQAIKLTSIAAVTDNNCMVMDV